MTTAAAIVRELHASADPGQYAKVLARVGDPAAVIGVRMRDVFDLAKRHPTLELDEIGALLDERSYEARMVAVSILDLLARGRGASADDRRTWAALYLDRHDRLDQWDLVDRAAPRVVGGWLLVSDPAERRVLSELAASSDPNRRRTAITATFWLVRHGETADALGIADRLVDDAEVLVRNSVAVALREVGRVNPALRDDFVRARSGRLTPALRRVALSE